ncbi:MAG TPA: hypothetical protein V6D03_12370, partial [Candidatus Caenarcaniphilales bacterium]
NSLTDRTLAKPLLVVAQSTPETPARAQPVGTERLLTIAAIGATAAGVIWSARKTNSGRLPHQSQESKIPIDQANSKLQKKLLRLLHNDRATASRLLSQVKLNHPERSINWAVEKVIYDLERDRH